MSILSFLMKFTYFPVAWQWRVRFIEKSSLPWLCLSIPFQIYTLLIFDGCLITSMDFRIFLEMKLVQAFGRKESFWKFGIFLMVPATSWFLSSKSPDTSSGVSMKFEESSLLLIMLSTTLPIILVVTVELNVLMTFRKLWFSHSTIVSEYLVNRITLTASVELTLVDVINKHVFISETWIRAFGSVFSSIDCLNYD